VTDHSEQEGITPSLLTAWTSFALGISAFMVYAWAHYHSLGLSHKFHPGFTKITKAAQAILDGMLIGWAMALCAVVLAVVGMLDAEKRRLKAMLAVPAIIYFSAPAWAFIPGLEGVLALK
jgi:hypothetical protein